MLEELNSSIAQKNFMPMVEASMFQNREEFSNARQHLHLLQSKVEKLLTLLVLQFDLWSSEDDGDLSAAEIQERCQEFRDLIDSHFKQVSGDGLLERAVTQHPSLAPVMRDVERWQSAILSDLDGLIVDLKSSPISQSTIAQYRNTIRRLQNEILAEEKQERHILERGWT